MNLNVKFNKYERIAGLFVVTAGLGMIVSFAGVAISQGWFESKSNYRALFETADGIHVGTAVNMSGLRIGSVESVDLLPDNRIDVHFRVFSRFGARLRRDSTAQLVRPFIIGDRILELTVGSPEAEAIAEGDPIKSLETTDLMTLFSGRKLGNALGEMGDMIKNLRFLAEAFLDKNRTTALVKIFDRMEPLLANLNGMATEFTKIGKSANKDDRVGTVLKELATLSHELSSIVPELKKRSPKVAADLETLVSNMAMLTAQIGPELPQNSRKAVEAMDEMVVVLKALQKSFLLRSSAQEVREEQKREEEARKPASEGGH